MKRWALIFLVLVFPALAGESNAQTFEVEHDHFWRSCKGTLTFSDDAVEYTTKKKDHRRSWKYMDIQQLAIAPGRITVLGYHSRKVDFGADQAFNFKVLSGTLDDQFRKMMEIKLARPLVSSILPEPKDVQFSIPVRHKEFWGDSQGILEFGAEYVIYRSANPKASGVWKYEELLSMGSTGPFQLRLGALQKSGGEFGEEKNYVFDLKRRLTPDEYDFLWEKINRPKIR